MGLPDDQVPALEQLLDDLVRAPVAREPEATALVPDCDPDGVGGARLAYPAWSIIIMAIDGLVIYGLIMYGRAFNEA